MENEVMRRRPILLIILLLGLVRCAEGSPEQSVQERCARIIETVAACYPGVSFEAECTEETLAKFEEYGLEGEDCDGVDKVGKADWFSFGGCGEGEHECGLIFCCDDYVVTWFPADTDWDIVGVVEDYQAQVPAASRGRIDAAGRQELLDGIAETWQQEVAEYAGGETAEMAVELSVMLVEVPYATFIERLPVADWGIRLDHYLGGEVIVYEEDDQDRPVRQLERMVLSPFPCDWDMALTNMDMTKVEVVIYEEDRATVYWRVMYSDNDSTEADVGRVAFISYDESSTLVEFHSAHRLNAPAGIHIPNDIVEMVLETFFLGHIEHYREIIASYY